MESLRTSWLLDEFQQSLHSKNDYAAALKHTLGVCPELEEYMKEFQLVVTGDYPTWKYNKKLVAEVATWMLKKYISKEQNKTKALKR